MPTMKGATYDCLALALEGIKELYLASDEAMAHTILDLIVE